MGTEAGGTFRIDPVRPVAELRADALAASPPEEPGPFRDSELVEVATLEPGILLDVRYATTNNFMSSVFYDEPRVFLQSPAADAVARAHRALAEHGFGLLLHDGYRPWYVTKMFFDATPESQRLFVADPANGSRHNRGSAIDLNLYDLETGLPPTWSAPTTSSRRAPFPTTRAARRGNAGSGKCSRRVMEAEGFTVYEADGGTSTTRTGASTRSRTRPLTSSANGSESGGRASRTTRGRRSGRPQRAAARIPPSLRDPAAPAPATT